jgi:predicted enzyme related to lactoylglutathione lyase
MSDNLGKFVWYDVMTTDCDAAGAFYRAVVGWTITDSGMSDRTYRILSAGEVMIGGLMPLPEDARAQGARPGWMGYIAVDDVDAYAARVTKAGGKVHRGPEDIPGVGRFAVVADPHGAAFILFRGMGDQAPQRDGALPGQIGWHELHARDRESAFAFYADLFGWTKSDAIDMGPMGIYQLFSTGTGRAVGGMMTKTPRTPQPFWLYYFTVAAIDAAVARIAEAGGQVIKGPMEVPGGSWVIEGLDPQGAMFALVAAQR